MTGNKIEREEGWATLKMRIITNKVAINAASLNLEALFVICNSFNI